jgi:ribosomal protein S18 acetylase RimI-like enzyme
MSSFFGRRKREAEPEYRQIPIVVPQKSPEEEGFTFETLDEKTIDEAVDAMMKAMPQVKWNSEGLKRILLSPNALTLIARRERAVVGVISGTVFPTPVPPPTVGLMAVTDPDAGERGVGGFLIDEFIKALQKRSPKATFVDVSLPTFDTGSIALYSLKGFMIEGFIKNGFGQGVAQGSHDLVILRRRLMQQTAQQSVV